MLLSFLFCMVEWLSTHVVYGVIVSSCYIIVFYDASGTQGPSKGMSKTVGALYDIVERRKNLHGTVKMVCQRVFWRLRYFMDIDTQRLNMVSDSWKSMLQEKAKKGGALHGNF